MINVGDIMMQFSMVQYCGDIMMHVGKYEYRGGICRDMMSTVGCSVPWGTQITKDFPPWYP